MKFLCVSSSGKDCSLCRQSLGLFDLWEGQSVVRCPNNQHMCGLGLATAGTAPDLVHGKRLEVGCAHPWDAIVRRCEGCWRNQRKRVNCRRQRKVEGDIVLRVGRRDVGCKSIEDRAPSALLLSEQCLFSLVSAQGTAATQPVPHRG